jgi:predicted PurR-regulated permease PerM
MTETSFDVDRFRMSFLLLLVGLISLGFVMMIRDFVTTLLLAAITTGLCYPTYLWLVDRLRGRASLAAFVMVVGVFVLIIGPLLLLVSIVTAQAVELAQIMQPWLEERLVAGPSGLFPHIDLPRFMQPYETQIAAKLGEFAGQFGQFALGALAGAGRGTAAFVVMLFLMLYAMFFFFRDGALILTRILYYMPLRSVDEMRLIGRFSSVCRATIKGTLAVGAAQGSLAGLGFYWAGIPGSVFWATIMAVLSIIPGVATTLVWVPTAIWLYLDGQIVESVGLTLWCIAVVGTVDNLLRPRLVGRDTQLSELLILVSTLGGLLLFGATGFVIGPILGALFVTVWEIYGEAFASYLPEADIEHVRSGLAQLSHSPVAAEPSEPSEQE